MKLKFRLYSVLPVKLNMVIKTRYINTFVQFKSEKNTDNKIKTFKEKIIFFAAIGIVPFCKIL